MTPEELRDRAEEILAREEFNEPEPSYLERALEWIIERIEGPLNDLLGALGFGGVGSGAAWLLLAVVVVILAVVIVRAVTRWEPAPRASSTSTTVSTMRQLSAQEWRDRARTAEAEGRFDEAVRCHHRATVAEVAERLSTTDEPGATSGVWRRRAASSGVADLDELTSLFDEVWYGDAPADLGTARRAARSPFESSAPADVDGRA